MTNKINAKTKKLMLKKVKELCVPAHGCTEIGAIGYGVAAASAQVKGDIKKVKSIIMEVSPYIFKNVMRVGVPNLGTCGIFMIGAGAAVIAKPERKLEMFSSITEKERQDAQTLVNKQILHVKIPSRCEPVYVKTIIKNGKEVIESLIEGVHDNLVYVRVNGKDVIKSVRKSTNKNTNKVSISVDDYKVEDLIEIANNCNEKELEFLPKLFQLNINISEYGKTNIVPGSYTETYKKLMDKKPSIYQQIILDTAAAIDARMNGAVLPVMSSCGSGDHGLTASIPQFTYHKLAKNSKITFLRSLLLTNLLV
ncbi:MAG: L-serine ammonia-lyase, iron-sulfur-dependent, subunit alpha [Mycoplasmoidaceae bacterium]|nr:L-serine ammonia-lyase, iron-sulfur-dependent, subunit alpha [Mycoplasmoidaceae bacterium]